MKAGIIQGGRVALLLALSAAIVLSGCQTTSKRDWGTGIGAGAGAIIGNRATGGSVAGTLIGMFVGGLIGRSIGTDLEESDRRQMADTLERNSTGQSRAWTNPDTGTEYRMTPTTGQYRATEGTCRQFRQEMVIDGQRKVVMGTACKQVDTAAWQMS